ncbi:MAG: DUF5721 family protein [Defluviitaleaceae bacterium]|nr:DUF5721 family protein [Defluviitaleaceae bacterium]
MIAVQMDPAGVKDFMNRLLREDILDSFEVRGVEMTIGTRISIDGNLVTQSEDENQEKPQGYTTWEALRPLLFAIIKTGAKPKQIKIIFSYKADGAKEIHPNAAALFLNMVYENDIVNFTTATAQKEFSLEKSLDDSWDEWVRVLFNEKNITVTDRE